MSAVIHKGVMRFTIQNFTAGEGGKKESLTEALQTEREEAGLKTTRNSGTLTMEGTPQTETKL